MAAGRLRDWTAAPARAAAPHLIGFVLPPLVLATAAAGGAWTFLPLLVVYGLLPLVDRAHPSADASRPGTDLARNPWFRAVTWAWVPVQLTLLGASLAAVARGALDPLATAGLTVSLGVTTGGVGITFAHELIHRASRLERALGDILLATVLYMHFAVEHVHGHHRHVGTPRDPATAKLGESSFAFLFRSVAGGARSAWAIESARVRRQGHDLVQNRVLIYAAVQVALVALVLLSGGWIALCVFLTQAAVAITLLELINYVEHYGLVRREIAPGRYERIAAWHSWDSNSRVSNWILVNLARHADHHLTASKRYQALRGLEDAPQLPAGYSGMILLALVPPLWRRVMDPRVRAWRVAHDASAERESPGAPA